MQGRLIAISFLAMLIVGSLPPVQTSHAAQPGTSGLLEMGYGPATLFQIGQGIPVYTPGQHLWFLSNFNGTLTAALAAPGGTLRSPAQTVEDGVPAPIYTFEPGDPPGTWAMIVNGGPFDNATIPVSVVSLSPQSAQLRLTSYSLAANQLSLAFNANLTGSYDVQACLAGSEAGSIVLDLPPEVGNGSISIQKAGENITAALTGSITSPFTFWFELYYPYSYSQSAANDLVSRDVRVAEASPILLTRTGNFTSTLTEDAPPLGVGRYLLRAYFEDPNGLYAAEAQAAIPDQDHWIWLGSCQLGEPNGSFTYQANLSSGTEAWPRTAYLMYRDGGVEGISSLELSMNISAISLVASPWGMPITEGATITPSSTAGFTQWGADAGTLYVLSPHLPTEAGVSIQFANETLQKEVTLPGPYSSQNVTLAAGRLTLHIVDGSNPRPVSSVLVTDSSNRTFAAPLNGSGYATLFLPNGTYVVKAESGNITNSETVDVHTGRDSSLILNLAASSAVQISITTEVILVAAGMAGIAANTFVWLTVVKRRGKKRETGIPQQSA